MSAGPLEMNKTREFTVKIERVTFLEQNIALISSKSHLLRVFQNSLSTFVRYNGLKLRNVPFHAYTHIFRKPQVS